MNYLYIGTYTETLPHVHGKGSGIYTYQFNIDRGELSWQQTTDIRNPSYLTLNRQKSVLYAVQETGDAQTSAVTAFQVDQKTGELLYLNEQTVYGAAPCHVSVDATGQFAFVANYMTGNVVVYPLAADGRLQPPSDISQHVGVEPHAHMVISDPTNEYVLAVDLGLDALFIYQRPGVEGRLKLLSQMAVVPHSGPRHLAFHPNGRVLFVLHELESIVTTWLFQAGKLVCIDTISTLPKGFTGANAPGTIRVSADGRFVYASNRWHDTLAVYRFDEHANRLTSLAHVPVQGKTPRDFILDPSGQFLLVANQDSDNVVVFRVDLETGLPDKVIQDVPTPTPVCLHFL